MHDEADNWWRQAQADFDAAQDNLGTDHHYLVAFLSHQATEKALKALYIQTERENVQTHNLVRLARDLDLPDPLVDHCGELNQDYISTRYPDAPTGVPEETYTEGMARSRIEKAEEVITWIEKRLTT